MRIKEGQMLELKTGLRMDAEEVIKSFAWTVVSAALAYFADNEERWEHFKSDYYEDNDAAHAAAAELVEKTAAFDDLLALVGGAHVEEENHE